MRRERGRAALAAAWLAIAPAASVRAAEEEPRAAQPGAYCPLPEKGEVPRCLSPAKDAYGDFFDAVEQGALEDEEGSEAALATVEEAVARGPGEAQAYLALSSLSYGYWRLAQRAAADADADPEIVERLARWNDLLARAYAADPENAEYRAAVRHAAEELSERARVTVPCRDAQGEATDCRSTESVVRGIHAASEEVGIRGALGRLLGRVLGSGP